MADQQRTLANLIQLFAAGQSPEEIDSSRVRDLIESVGRCPYGGLHTTGAPIETVISAQNTYTKVLGTTVISNVRGVSMPVNNRLRYDGVVPYHFHMACTISFSSAGANKDVGFKIFEFDDSVGSGAVQDGSLVQRNMATAVDIGSTAIHWDMTMDTNDYIELHVANLTDAVNITVEHLYYFMMGMPM